MWLRPTPGPDFSARRRRRWVQVPPGSLCSPPAAGRAPKHSQTCPCVYAQRLSVSLDVTVTLSWALLKVTAPGKSASWGLNLSEPSPLTGEPLEFIYPILLALPASGNWTMCGVPLTRQVYIADRGKNLFQHERIKTETGSVHWIMDPCYSYASGRLR